MINLHNSRTVKGHHGKIEHGLFVVLDNHTTKMKHQAQLKIAFRNEIFMCFKHFKGHNSGAIKIKDVTTKLVLWPVFVVISNRTTKQCLTLK